MCARSSSPICLLRPAESWAVAFSLSQGLLTDVYSGGPRGLFAAPYLAVYGIDPFGEPIPGPQWVKGQIVIVAGAVFIKYCLLFLIVKSFPLDLFIEPPALWMVGLSSVAQRSRGPGCVRPHPLVQAVLRGGNVGSAT